MLTLIDRLKKAFAAILGILAATVTSTTLAQAPQVLFTDAFTVARDMPTFVDPTIIYFVRPNCGNVPGDELSPALISRAGNDPFTPFAVHRKILSFNPPRPVATCNPYQLLSDIVVDADFLYYIDNQGAGGNSALWRRARNANVPDASELIVDFGSAITSGELLLFSTVIFVILHRPGQNDVMLEYFNDGAGFLAVVETAAAGAMGNMQHDGRFLYWVNGPNLRRNDLTNGAQVTVVTGGISSYHLEGYDMQCSPLGCEEYSRILYAQGNKLFEKETISGGVTPQYTSPDAGATILAITRDTTRFYFIERRAAVPGGPFDRADRIFRLPVGNTVPSLLHGPVNNGGPGFDSFTTDLTWLYFRDRQTRTVYRLANDTAAIPIQRLSARGLEITQGIQAPDNHVRLIEGKRAFVRFYVRSDGPTDVAGVTAALQGQGEQVGYLGSLSPINRVGKRITVRRSPSRASMDHAFLFELPLSWTVVGPVTLTATVNSSGGIAEESFDDNSSSAGPLTFSPDPGLRIGYINMSYLFTDGVVRATLPEDEDSSQSWIRRLYPVASSIVVPEQHIRDDALSSRVDRTARDCLRFLTDKVDDRNQCAAAYVSEKIRALRFFGALPADRIWYGNIPQVSDALLTRGFSTGDRICMGPSGSAAQDIFLNYAAHEIGHECGRPHPAKDKVPSCGHSHDDLDYPYEEARITGSSNDQINNAGFDPGTAATDPFMFLNGARNHDTMSYCPPYWISDWTFHLMYNFIATELNQGNGGGLAAGAGAAVEGDWLIVTGTLTPGASTGGFGVLYRVSSVVDSTPPVPNGFTLEVRGDDDALLASHGFTANPVEDGPAGLLTFDMVVPFEPGTRKLRAIEEATGRVLASAAVSAQAPSVSDVQLAGAPEPVEGTVTITWAASDADGDAISHDLFSSRDGGVSYKPLALSVAGASFDLDTSSLAGGTTLFRVVATDGVNTAHAESAPFEVAPKPPVVAIASPADGLRVQWLQLITFEADARDAQDEELVQESLVWSTQYGTLGTGRVLQTRCRRRRSGCPPCSRRTSATSFGSAASRSAQPTAQPGMPDLRRPASDPDGSDGAMRVHPGLAPLGGCQESQRPPPGVIPSACG